MTTSLKDLSDQVAHFVDQRDWARFHSPRNLAMALSVEASELLELYLWCDDTGPQLSERRQTQVADEAADVLICLLNFCRRADIDLASALTEKLAKAERKYPVERVRGKRMKYNEYEDYRDEE